jgi:hypothetical protein
MLGRSKTRSGKGFDTLSRAEGWPVAEGVCVYMQGAEQTQPAKAAITNTPNMYGCAGGPTQTTSKHLRMILMRTI